MSKRASGGTFALLFAATENLPMVVETVAANNISQFDLSPSRSCSPEPISPSTSIFTISARRVGTATFSFHVLPTRRITAIGFVRTIEVVVDHVRADFI
jgi:hypothetical protein